MYLLLIKLEKKKLPLSSTKNGLIIKDITYIILLIISKFAIPNIFTNVHGTE